MSSSAVSSPQRISPNAAQMDQGMRGRKRWGNGEDGKEREMGRSELWKGGTQRIEEWRVTGWEDTWREIRQMQKTDGTDSELNFYKRLGGE